MRGREYRAVLERKERENGAEDFGSRFLDSTLGTSHFFSSLFLKFQTGVAPTESTTAPALNRLNCYCVTLVPSKSFKLSGRRPLKEPARSTLPLKYIPLDDDDDDSRGSGAVLPAVAPSWRAAMQPCPST